MGYVHIHRFSNIFGGWPKAAGFPFTQMYMIPISIFLKSLPCKIILKNKNHLTSYNEAKNALYDV